MNKKIGDFEIKGTIGQGTFGLVKEGLHLPTGEKVAIKILEKRKIIQKDDLKRIFRQISILKKIFHPNIIQLYQLLQTQKSVYIITQYIKGGQLYNLIVQKGKLQESISKKYLFKIIDAVEYLHTQHITHRDLKPENILIQNDENIKIIDFGLSTQFQQSQLLETSCGSPCYAAPEMIRGDKYNPIYTDVWSIGIIMYAMICGYLPFQDTNTKKLYKKVLKGIFEIPQFISDSGKDLLKKLIKVSPKQRIRFEDIKNHEWFYGIKSNIYFMEQNLIHQNIITMIEKLMSVNRQKIQNYIMAQKHSPIYTYYYLLKKKLGKTLAKNQNSLNRKRIHSQFHRKDVNQNNTFQVHSGPIHLNYVFLGKYNHVKIQILDKLSKLQPKFKNFQTIIFPQYREHQLKLKILNNSQDAYYLDIPFYFPLQL